MKHCEKGTSVFDEDTLSECSSCYWKTTAKRRGMSSKQKVMCPISKKPPIQPNIVKVTKKELWQRTVCAHGVLERTAANWTAELWVGSKEVWVNRSKYRFIRYNPLLRQFEAKSVGTRWEWAQKVFFSYQKIRLNLKKNMQRMTAVFTISVLLSDDFKFNLHGFFHRKFVWRKSNTPHWDFFKWLGAAALTMVRLTCFIDRIRNYEVWKFRVETQTSPAEEYFTQ